jgi:hypothetical protein
MYSTPEVVCPLISITLYLWNLLNSVSQIKRSIELFILLEFDISPHNLLAEGQTQVQFFNIATTKP